MRRILLVLLLLVTVAGCARGGDTPAGGGSYTVRVGGTDRHYRVHVPASSAGKSGLPAVIVLHGGGGNGGQIETQTGFSDVADRHGFLAVYPDGSGRTKLLTWNAGTCCAYAMDQKVDDVAFVRTLIDTLRSRFGVDRVFVTGFSNGAMLTYRVGCELADRVTAIAPVSGSVAVPTCTPSRPLPVYAIHGDADRIVPYAGGKSALPIGGTHIPVASSIGFWTTADRCTGQPVRTVNRTVTTLRYASCATGTEVRLDTIAGGGHAWPGGKATRSGADQPSRDLDASATIWDFFATHNG